jgi:hypothetical protein
MTTETRAPKTSWCWWCRRATEAGRRLIETDEGTVALCERCWNATAPVVALDMTRVDDDDRD